MFSLIGTLVFAFMLALPFSLARADDSARYGDLPGDIATGVDLRVASADVWPWGYRTESGELAGTLVTFYDRLSVLIGKTFHNVLRPHRRVIRELESGRVDLAVLYESPTTEQAGILVAPVIQVRVLLAGLADSQLKLSLGGGLAGRTVAYIRGTYYGEAFEQDDSIRKVAVKDLRQAVEMLLRGRVDALVASDQSFFSTLHEMGLGAERFRLSVALQQQDGALYLSRASSRDDLVPELRRAVETMRRNGDLAEIFHLP